MEEREHPERSHSLFFRLHLRLGVATIGWCNNVARLGVDAACDTSRPSDKAGVFAAVVTESCPDGLGQLTSCSATREGNDDNQGRK